MQRGFRRRLGQGVAAAAIVAQLGTLAAPAAAFCGFYVAKADSKLFNKSSKVVLAWEDGKTAVTMASDYEGDPKEFAVVVPVPTLVQKQQIDVVEMKALDHLDAYTAPRLVEYRDGDPCAPLVIPAPMSRSSVNHALTDAAPTRDKALGVTIEASYEVGEYDILILSARESDGLSIWLRENGYRIPDGAGAVLDSYIKQKMHFFVAKVSLERMEQMGHRFLRPLQVRYETPKFMLPIRLGTVNADGPQDMIVLALTRKGRIETSNYRTVKLPTGMDVPLYVKDDFGKFYTAMFERQAEREREQAVFLEYAWDLSWCDPCAADPMASRELAELGAGWVDKASAAPAANAFVTRLHVRYDARHFPEDLAFLETRDRENFQGRYVLHHPWTGDAACEAGRQYRAALPERFQREAETLADLTGWRPADIRARMAETGQPLRSQGLRPDK